MREQEVRARLQRLIKHEHQVKHGGPPHCCGVPADGPHDDLCLWDALRQAIAALSRVEEAQGWQQAGMMIARLLFEAGYKGDGIVDGVQWLIAQLPTPPEAAPAEDGDR